MLIHDPEHSTIFPRLHMRFFIDKTFWTRVNRFCWPPLRILSALRRILSFWKKAFFGFGTRGTAERHCRPAVHGGRRGVSSAAGPSLRSESAARSAYESYNLSSTAIVNR